VDLKAGLNGMDKDKSMVLRDNETRFLRCLVRSLVTVPTELSQLVS
jgi:hypothetical protein